MFSLSKDTFQVNVLKIKNYYCHLIKKAFHLIDFI